MGYPPDRRLVSAIARRHRTYSNGSAGSEASWTQSGPAKYSGVGRPAVDRDGLAGDKIAVAGCEKDQRTQQILGILVALDGAALDRNGARLFQVRGVLQRGLAQRIAGRQRVDADAVIAQLAAERAGKAEDCAFRRDVMQHLRHAARRRARADIDDLAAATR